MDAFRSGPGAVLGDPLLAGGRLLLRGPGKPVVYGGNFALTFVIDAGKRRFAVRCFQQPTEDLQARYAAIHRHLGAIASPYFVDFEFQPAGITTESGTHPLVRMDWAEGQTLDAFIARSLRDASTLRALRDSLRRLAANLAVCRIAHGDIQPSNIVVESPDRVRLIDYDGMFVPELGGRASAEIGQRNFQHPGRRAWHFDECLDRFSFIALDLALDALIKQPDLWDATESGEDAVVFRAQDYADPASSPAFRAVARIPRMEQRAQQLAAVCLAPFERVPPFSDFLAGRNIPETTVVFSGSALPQGRRPYAPPHPVLDATSFARCCKHVGKRVELVGRVLRVARSHTSRLQSTCLRVEFGQRGHDAVCLRIWPDAEPGFGKLPDDSWVGQWVSAVGLLEPVTSTHDGFQRQRDISMSLGKGSQLQRLTPAEARRRLRGCAEATRPVSDPTSGVRTDPVLTDRAPLITVDVTRRPHGGTRPARLRTGRVGEPPNGSTATERNAARPPPPARPAASLPPPPAAAGEDAATPADGCDVATPPLPQAPRPPTARPPVRARAALLAIGATAGLVVLTVVLTRPGPEDRPAEARSQEASAVAASERHMTAIPVPTPEPASRPAQVKLESQVSLQGARLPIETRAGPIEIGADIESAGSSKLLKLLVIDGKPFAGLRDDAIALAHRATYSDREVLTGFARCAGTRPPCGVRRPFWLVLRPNQPVEFHEAPGIWSSSTAGAVQAAEDGVRVNLGTWNGQRRAATLTLAGTVEISRQPARIVPLKPAECAVVAASLEACASSSDCRTPAASARPIPRRSRDRLNRIFHEQTGLDAAAFMSLCVRSCELGLTPSENFIRTNACSGASRGQWTASDPTVGLLQQ